MAWGKKAGFVDCRVPRRVVAVVVTVQRCAVHLNPINPIP